MNKEIDFLCDEKKMAKDWINGFREDEFLLGRMFVKGAFPFGNGTNTIVAHIFTQLHLEIRFLQFVFHDMQKIGLLKETFFDLGVRYFIVAYMQKAISQSYLSGRAEYIEKVLELMEVYCWSTPNDVVMLRYPKEHIENEKSYYIFKILRNNPFIVLEEECYKSLVWACEIVKNEYYKAICKNCE